MSSVEWGRQWPLTVEGGTVRCEDGQVTFEAPDGARYAVNGTALQNSGLPKINPIWADNPAISGSKIDISPIIDTGLAICDGTPPPSPPGPGTPVPTPVQAIPEDGIATIEALLKAYEEAGGRCPKPDGPDRFDDGSAMVTCYPNLSSLVWFPNAAAAKASVDKTLQPPLPPEALLVGPNWFIAADDVGAVAKKLGGKVVLSPRN
ncbi:MAG: DUF2511 domain-containing protein [Actinomycetota bacterium]|nr:DUF2511 domain-containing protein [Actinomycetota bacterium]